MQFPCSPSVATRLRPRPKAYNTDLLFSIWRIRPVVRRFALLYRGVWPQFPRAPCLRIVRSCANGRSLWPPRLILGYKSTKKSSIPNRKNALVLKTSTRHRRRTHFGQGQQHCIKVTTSCLRNCFGLRPNASKFCNLQSSDFMRPS